MSHFSVMVIGENVEEQLAPYHEFECTGIDDEYVIDVDETEEYRTQYNESTRTRIKSPDGKLFESYGDEFYREPTEDELKQIGIGGIGSVKVNGEFISFHSKDWGDGKGYRPKVRFIPEGWGEVKIPINQIESFREYVESDYDEGFFVNSEDELDMDGTHKYGYGVLDENGEVLKVINRTNPNRKWDWYEIGGRWAGMLPIKPEHQSEYIGNEPNFSWGWEEGQKVKVVIEQLKQDSALKGHIDFDYIKNTAQLTAEEEYDFVYTNVISKEEKGRTLNDIYTDTTIENHDEKRKLYNNQPIVKLFEEVCKDSDLISTFYENVEDFYISRDAYVTNKVNSAIPTYAVVIDGEWYERGKMGWWGISDDKMTQDEWNCEFMKLLESVDDNTLLTVVDCHI
jgi:hypothetical protein